ncbi:MAG: class I SAM-dependent methyltransferase [Candidatus Lutacidiplasmatales archaeon]
MAPAPKHPTRRRRTPATAGHVRHNRAVWDRISPSYDRRFAAVLGGSSSKSWGLFRVPERELRLLGPTRRKSILELGCGAARWSMALARGGARPTGLDLSAMQLARARELQQYTGLRFPLVRGSAENLPFRDATFDLVFCDWGAMTFSDPERSVPEAVRVLRTGGRFVFVTASPLRYLTLDVATDRQTRRLVRPYFGTYRHQFAKGETVEFTPPYGVWVDLFRRNGLAVEQLVETRPTPAQGSKYLSRSDAEWGRSWPLEVIWKLVKE